MCFRYSIDLVFPIARASAFKLATFHKFKSAMNCTIAKLPSIRTKVPTLSNFTNAKSAFKKFVVEGKNRELERVWLADSSTLDTFRTIFPELVQSRGLTQLPDDAFRLWDEPSANRKLVEEDCGKSVSTEQWGTLAVGGPSSVCAALLSKLHSPHDHVLHAVTDRHDSNHDGSAYYYHQRDAVPVYVNRVNRGPYCVYIDLKKRLMGPARLAAQAEADRHHVKISLNWRNIKPLQHPFTIFIPNFYHMVMDIYLREPKQSGMRHAVEHACLTDRVVEHLTEQLHVPKETFTIHSQDSACYVGFQGGSDPHNHFTWLNKYVYLPFHDVDKSQYGPLVNRVLAFPRDGLISPGVIADMKALLVGIGGHTREGFQLRKIFVKADPVTGKLRATKVAWRQKSDVPTQPDRIASVDRLLLSLGPSASFEAVPGQSVEKAAWLRRGINAFKRHVLPHGRNLLKDFMWAAGSSSVVLIALDTARVPLAKRQVLLKFLDGVNQHWTPIVHRDVEDGGRVWHCIALQMTGGGNFPSRLSKPDYVLNLLYTTEEAFGLRQLVDEGAITYDLVQSRGCGRAVSARNTISFLPLAENCVVNYALGGIGMSTMFPNALLMHQLLRAPCDADKLRQGVVADTERLMGKNVFEGIDYTTMVDDHRTAARAMGVDNSLSAAERVWLCGIASAAAVLGAALLL